tara:strand:- start:131 stop:892 length:762 start_codon:yes stop_codon:yes gene_type:complete
MIRATITIVKAYADVDYIKATAVDYLMTPESEYRFEYETLTLSEVAAVLLTKNLSDSFAYTDVAILDMSKGLAHNFAFADSLDRTVNYYRSITDAFTLDDIAQVEKDIGANKGNIATITDILGYGFTKPLTDTTTLSDVLAGLVAKVLSDSFSFSDSESLDIGQGLAHSFSFSDSQNYNLGKGESDSFSYADVQAFTHSKSLTDAFTLDDATLVNKNYSGVKGNVFSFTDTISISRTHGAALGFMVLGTTTLN